MLHRSLFLQVRRHLERIIGSDLPPGEALRELADSVPHDTVVGALGRLGRLVAAVHPRFQTRTYEVGSVTPEITAYWLVEIAQRCRERLCHPAEDVPSAEHYGACEFHGRHLAALTRAFISCVENEPGEAILDAYREAVRDLRRDTGARLRDVDLLIDQLDLPSESQRRIVRDAANDLCGDPALTYELVDEVRTKGADSGKNVSDQGLQKIINEWRARRNIVNCGAAAQ